MADVTSLIKGQADPLEQRSLVKGFISTGRPAPKAFPTITEIAKGESTNLLWVIVPEHSTEVPYGPCNWAALHGSTLPAQGAACVVALDQKNKPTVVWWEGPQTPLLVSALPASPTDGQECFFQNAAMAAEGVVWRFRYRTGSASTHKWEFVGGAPMWETVPTEQSFTGNNTWQDPATAGPDILVPLTGDYIVEVDTEWKSITNPLAFNVGVAIGAGATPGTFTSDVSVPGVLGNFQPAAYSQRLTELAAGGKLRVRYLANGETPSVRQRHLRVTPVRVG